MPRHPGRCPLALAVPARHERNALIGSARERASPAISGQQFSTVLAKRSLRSERFEARWALQARRVPSQPAGPVLGWHATDNGKKKEND